MVNMTFKLISWTMTNDESVVDKTLKELKAKGHLVEKRTLKNKEFKFGIYLKE